jgi:mitochondrial inner membrane protein COX18
MLPSLRNNLLRPSTRSTIISSSLQLPPNLRTRLFHATPRPQFYEPLISSAHAVLETVHSASGLPWAYSIPLSALLIRLTLVLPIGIYSRRCSQKQASLFPILTSWQHPLRKEAMAEVGHLGPMAAQKSFLKKIRKKRGEVYKRWGCQTWKVAGLPLLQLPVFLVVIEAVRKVWTHPERVIVSSSKLGQSEFLVIQY